MIGLSLVLVPLVEDILVVLLRVHVQRIVVLRACVRTHSTTVQEMNSLYTLELIWLNNHLNNAEYITLVLLADTSGLL